MNLVLKVIWSHKLIRHAEQRFLLGKDQCGSRPCQLTVDVVLRKSLTYAITHQNKTELITFDNDAKSCYDRILSLLAAMASRRVGMPLIPCQLFTRSLEGMKYYTKVGRGLCESWYKHNEAYPIYGTGQGSCASPVVWTLISVVLINALQHLHQGMIFQTPDGKTVTKRPIDGFVDDTTIGTNMAGEHQTCLQEAQELARTWEHLLFLSGGTLAREKCFYYHINWQWHEGRATMVNPEDLSIAIPRGDQEPDMPISRKASNEAHRTLGVRLAPDGSCTTELNFLKSKVKKFANRLITVNLSTTEASLAYRTIFVLSMLYSAGVTGLSRRQCEQLQKIASPAWLNALGFNRHFPQAVAYAPKSGLV